jgi:hypothetical protein
MLEAKTPSKAASMAIACENGSNGESMDFGTAKLPIKPMAYRKVAKNAR